MADLKVWQYSIPYAAGSDWAEVMIREDGFFATVSGFGAYAYRWCAMGVDDARKFFLRIAKDPGYFATKFNYGRVDKVDYEASVERFKRELLRLRRHNEIDRSTAQHIWDNVVELHGDDWEGILRDSDDEFHKHFPEPWEFTVMEQPSQAIDFCERIGPRLADAIRQQMQAEKEPKNGCP